MKNLSKILTFVFGFVLLTISQVHAAGSVTFYHHDALGSVVASSHEDGYVNWNEEYRPYGQKEYNTVDNEGNSDEFYTGKNYNRDIDLTYFGARWYDAKQGRFLSMDPAPVVLDELHTFNRYVYSNNNPYSFIDPDGENAVTAFGGLIVETGNFVTGKGFDGGAVLGALSDGYNGEGAGFAASAYQDATEIIPVGKILGFLSKGVKIGVKWNNGWRTADGKFASPNGAGRSGAAAEQSVWDAVKQKPGWNVIEGQVGVRNASGQLRYYDGAAVSPRGRVIGLEVKSGSATKTPAQRSFDSGINTNNPAVGVGNNKGLEVGRSIEIRR